jgi:hypothetical protein
MNRGSPNLVLDREDEERVQRGVSESVRGPEAARRAAPNRLRFYCDSVEFIRVSTIRNVS